MTAVSLKKILMNAADNGIIADKKINFTVETV